MDIISIGDLWVDVTKYVRLKPTKTLTSALALIVIIRIYQSRRRLRTPRLQGPRNESSLFRLNKKTPPSSDIGIMYRDWERAYGPVYEIPAGMGSRHIVLSDPKAITHFFSKDTTTYRMPLLQRIVVRRMSGDVLTAIEGEDHKRQRKAMSSAFSISAIRSLVPVFLDSTYKLKAAWDSSFQSTDRSANGVIIDVQKWMSYVAMDNVGNAGFSHDFGTLKGQTSSLMTGFDFGATVKPSSAMILSLFVGLSYPNFFAKIFGKRWKRYVDKQTSQRAFATDLLNNAKKDARNGGVDRSILGVMLKSENANSNVHLSTDEVIAEIMFISAGYGTMTPTLTWALIEFCRNPEMQQTLRTELQESFIAGGDPTYDQLMNELPYLDAFTCELLRVHPVVDQTLRVVNEEDTIPLTEPIRTASGTMIDGLFVEKGTIIRIPFAGVNISEALWGRDAATFNPGRWLVPDDDQKERKEEVKGHRHLLTFAYGPRMCPARNFAIMEIKAVLSVLVRNFAFEFPDGPSTKIENHFMRPKVAGEEGAKVPVLVRKAM